MISEDIQEANEITVNELLEAWRILLLTPCTEVDDEDIEYITVDGTKDESEDRGLDFEVL